MSLLRPTMLQVALVVHRREVAGVHPAGAVDRLGGPLGVLPVAEHDAVAARAQLAGLAALDASPVSGSTTFTSTCGPTRPTVPTRRSSGSSARVWVETGEVSVMP